MIKSSYDKELNAVVIEFIGKVDLKQGETFFSEIKKVIPKTKDGFRLLTDLSPLEFMDLKAREIIKKSMDLFNQLGVKEIFRVIPDPEKDIGFGIMSRFHYSSDVHITTLKSRAEAEERLKEAKNKRLIEHVRKVQRGEAPQPPIAKLLQMRITQVEEGRVEMQMPIDERYANPIGTLHGGIMCDLGDAAMGTAFATTCEVGDSYTTIELKCNFLRPVWDGELTAYAWVVSRGKTIGLAECEIRDTADRLIAKLSSTLTVLHGEAAKGRALTHVKKVK